MKFIRILYRLLLLVLIGFCAGRYYEMDRDVWRLPTPAEIELIADLGPSPFQDDPPINKAGQTWGWLTNGRGHWRYQQLERRVVGIHVEGKGFKIRVTPITE